MKNMNRIKDNKFYVEYMKSDVWKQKSKERLEIDNYECVMCGKYGELHTHHITYNHLGSENVYTDLVTVCPTCHVLLHNYYRRVKGTPKA